MRPQLDAARRSPLAARRSPPGRSPPGRSPPAASRQQPAICLTLQRFMLEACGGGRGAAAYKKLQVPPTLRKSEIGLFGHHPPREAKLDPHVIGPPAEKK